MTCARREAGAHRPAPSAGTSRPDPRPGRRRARLSLLLPALALLLGALSPFAAAPAEAQTTIWSATLTVDAQGNTDFPGCDDDDTSTNCSTALTDNDFTFKGTTWRIKSFYISRFGQFYIQLNKAVPEGLLLVRVGDKELSTADAKVLDFGASKNLWRWDNTGISWTHGQTVSLSLVDLLSVTDLTASVVDRNGLDLIWRAPAATVTGYDVHYTSAAEATAPPDAEVSGNDPAAGWVDAGHSGTGAWHSITGLTYGTAYRLRVRATSAGNSGAWLHGTKAVPVTAPTAVRALSVVGGDRRLILSWAAPSDTGGAAVSYRAEYTSSTTIADDAPITNPGQPTVSWVELRNRNSHRATSPHTFFGLGNGAFYRGRVQAYNSAGSSPWVAAGDTVTATAGPRLTGLSVKVGDTLIVLTPTFGGDHLVYEATVPHDAANVTVTPTWTATGVTVEAASQSPDDGRTAVYTNPTTISSSGSSATLDLARSGDTDAFVTSCKGTVCTNYRIGVSRAPAPPAPPSEPRNVQATPGDAKLTLTWDAPMSWGGRAKGFLVEWKLSSAGDSAWQGVHGGQMAPTATSYEFTGENLNVDLTTHTVANGTAYDLRIKAVNHNRENDDSDWVEAFGTPAAQTVAPPSVPQSVAVTPGDGKLTITWAAPSDWGDWTAERFAIEWKLSSAGDSAWKNVSSATVTHLGPADASFEFTGAQTDGSGTLHTVANGTAYDLRIRAVSQQPGTNGQQASHFQGSPWVAVFDSVPSTVPAAPTGLDVRQGDGLLDLTWTAPLGTVTGYDVHYTASSSVDRDADAFGRDPASAWVDARHTGTAASRRIAGLDKGTVYRVRVRAVNAVGDGAWAHGAQSVPATVPGAPTHLSVAPGNTRLDASWLAPADDGGSALTGYDVHYTASASVDGDAEAGTDAATDWVAITRTEASPPAVTQAVTGLSNGTAYRVRVRASNALGSSAWLVASGTFAPTTATPPRLTGVSLSVGSTAVPLTPATFNGNHLTYTATVPHDATSVTVTPTWTGMATDVSTMSEDGDGTSVTSTTGISSSGDSATVDLASSGDTIVSVNVQAGLGGTEYRITVSRAPEPPSVPRNVQATPGDHALTLTWDAPRSWGAAPADGFEVQWKLSSAGASAWSAVATRGRSADIDATRTGFDFTDTQTDGSGNSHTVANGTAYDLRVRAVSLPSGGGNEVFSDWVEAFGTPASVAGPREPQNVAVTPGDGKLTLTWQAPSSWGDWTALGFEVSIKKSTGSVDDWRGPTAHGQGLGPTVTSFEFRGEFPDAQVGGPTTIANGTSYDVRIRAISQQDGTDGMQDSHFRESPWVAVYDSVPSALPAPGAVTALTVTGADTVLLLRWTAPSETLTGYDIHYTSASADDVANNAAAGADAATGWKAASRTEADPPSTIGAVPGLTNDTPYRVRVRARNGSSAGPWKFGTGTPNAAAVNPPTVPQSVAVKAADGKLTLTWAAPSNWGSWPASGYSVQWKLSSADDTHWAAVRAQGAGAVIGPTETSFEFTGTDQRDLSGTSHTIANGTAYDLRIRATSQKSSTDGNLPEHYKTSDWVTVLNKVPMAQPDRLPPVASTASQTLWSATLTVRDGQTHNGQPIYRGCDRTGNVRGCTVHLTDDDFTFDGTVHEVTRVSVTSAGALGFEVNRSLAGKKRRLVLQVDSVPFHGRDATFLSGTNPADRRLGWTNAGLSWSTGDTVQLSLVELPTVQLSVTPNPVTEGERVSVTASLLRGSGSSRAVQHIPAGVVKVPVIVTAGTAEARFDYGEGAPRADGTRRYLVSVNGTHRVNFGTVNFNTHKDGDRDDETFTVAVDTASLSPSLVAGDASSVTVTIEDLDEPVDSRPTVKLSVNPDRVREGGPVGVSVLMSSGLAADVTIPVTVTRGTSEERDHGTLEHGGASGDGVLIPAGTCCRTALVYTHVDGDTDDETFTVALDAASLPASVRLDPDAPDSVTVTIVDDGRPGIVTERSVTAREGQDDNAVFTVRLGGAVAGTVSVDYATADTTASWTGSDGPATAGADYTATSGTLTFAAGETEKTVSVPILDDAVDEGTEHFVLRYSNPRGAVLSEAFRETVGLIENDDHLQAMWLARFGRTVASQVTEAVSDRLGAGLAPGAHVTLAGQNLDLSKAEDGEALAEAMTGLARRFGAEEAPAGGDLGSGSKAGDPFAQPGLRDTWNDPANTTTARSMTGREVLLGSSFHVAPANEGSGPALAAWGRVAQAGFDGEHEDDSGTTRVDGEVVTGVLGADADFGRVLAGVAVSLSEGDGTFDAPEADVGKSGKIESTMTTVSPYARLKLTERVSAWGLAGWGTGDMTIGFDDGSMAPIRTDLTMQLGAIGARGELLTQGPDGGMDLALKADAFFVRTKSEKAANSAETQADASRVRLVLEGGRRFALSDTATIRPSLELGVRQDGGDAETGAGFEVGGGVAWSDTASGLSIEAKGRMLVAHADSDYEEWGASATARLDPGERGRGLSFSLAPTIGAASSGSERLWGAQRPRELAPDGEFEAARGLTAEAGYGMALFGDRFTGTPNLGFGMSDGGARDYRLGWRLTSAIRGDPGFEVNLDATRREAANGNEPPEHGVMLRSLIRW